MIWAIIIGIFALMLVIIVVGNVLLNSLFHYTVNPALERMRPSAQLAISLIVLVAFLSWVIGFGWALLLTAVAAGVTFVVFRASPERLSFYARKDLPFLDRLFPLGGSAAAQSESLPPGNTMEPPH